MNIAKAVKKLNNLKRIKGIVQIARFDTLQKLSNTQSIKDHHYEMSDIGQEVLSFAEFKYKLSTNLSKTIKNNSAKKKLLIFITIPSSLLKISYSKEEKMLLENYDKESDSLILVGDPAIDFAKKKKLNVYAEFQDMSIHENDVISIVSNIVTSKNFDEVSIISKSPKSYVEPFIIYPVKTSKNVAKEYKKYTFYHSLSESITNIQDTYFENVIKGISQETYRYYYQEKLIKHEGSIKNIDERIASLKINMNKIERKKETEEMIQVAQLAKRGGENE